jgi:5-methylcytosine-specific restriction endonuclease McrA
VESVIDKTIVLQLNKAWQPIGYKTVRKAISDMTAGSDELDPPFLGVDISYELDETGEWNFEQMIGMRPVSWGEWIYLPIRPYDLFIRTARQQVRVPTVIVSSKYNKMPKRTPKPNSSGIWERDGNTCQYTGKKLTKHEGNIDHVIPRDRGGKDTWENMVLCHKEINSKKGNKLNIEAGLKLIRQPKAPLPTPISALIKEARHRDWEHFLIK